MFVRECLRSILNLVINHRMSLENVMNESLFLHAILSFLCRKLKIFPKLKKKLKEEVEFLMKAC